MFDEDSFGSASIIDLEARRAQLEYQQVQAAAHGDSSASELDAQITEIANLIEITGQSGFTDGRVTGFLS